MATELLKYVETQKTTKFELMGPIRAKFVKKVEKSYEGDGPEDEDEGDWPEEDDEEEDEGEDHDEDDFSRSS